MVLRESVSTSSPSTSPPTNTTHSSALISSPTSPSQPNTSTQATSSPSLRRLLDETSDLIESPPFTQILTLLLDIAFSHLTDHNLRREAFKLSPLNPISAASEPRISDITLQNDPAKASTKLATILAVLTRQAHAIGHGLPNEYAQAMEGVREMEAFAAVIFTEGFELDAPEPRGGTPSHNPESELPRETGARSRGPADGGEAQPTGGMVSRAWAGFEGVWDRVTGESK